MKQLKQYTQKEAIHLMHKSENLTLTELADHLGVRLSSFRVTIEKNRLSFLQFCRIYKYIYKVDYTSENKSFDLMRSDLELSLRSFINVIQGDNKKLIVTLYKKTKIQIINPTD